MDGAHLLAGLDADQRRAVVDPGEPLCILAGAGSGKTRVLTRRIARRCIDGSADPRHVLALTFTRKAAEEMRNRLAALGLRDQPTVGTFHAVAWAQVRTWWRDQGRAAPALLDRKARFLSGLPGRSSLRPAELAAEIEWARARLVTPDTYAHAADRDDRRPPGGLDHVAERFAVYEQEKRRRGVVDFDDILEGCAAALAGDPAFAAAQRWRFRHLFVDEFQDVNPLQHRLLGLWRGDRPDLCVVGDPDQAIYRWNGADAGFLRRFADHNPGATVIALRGNYRSTPQILHLAAAALGPGATPRMRAHRPAGAVPTITSFPTDRDEAHGAAAAIRSLHLPGGRWDRQAVLVRTNAQMPLVEEALTQARIPFRLRGGEPLLSRADVRDAMTRTTRNPMRPLVSGLADLDALAATAAETPGQEDTADALAALLRLGRDLSASDPRATVGDLRGWVAAAIGADGPGRSGDAIDVVTFHAAKGLEWPVVHLLGLEDGLVPISHARTPEAEAEERRLLHVAVTRAEDVLRLSWAEERTWRDRTVPRRPSPYLDGLSDALHLAVRDARPAPPAAGLAAARQALAGATVGDAHLALLHALRAWREEAARRGGVPPSVVASDRVLSEIAHRRPADRAQLGEVRGVGPLTIDAHGDAILDVVADHRDRREPEPVP